MTFLNPAYFAALGLAAIPVLIHLIRRRRIRVIEWAAWDFLLEAVRKNRRRLQLEQLILLLLRILIVCLVVIALCRPVLRTTGLPLIASESHVHALIALDNSVSMGFVRDGVSDFDRARRAAEIIVARTLRNGDSVSLVLNSNRPEGVFKEPTYDLNRVRDALRIARISDNGTDYARSAALCAQILKNSHAPVREVYWITDSQKTGIPESAQQKTRAAFKDLATVGRVTWVDIGTPVRDNLSVESPRFSRELITPRTPVRLDATVHNHGDAPKDNLLVNLTVDGRPAGSYPVNVPAHGTARARLTYLFESAGYHSGMIRLGESEALSRDDTAFFAVRVREKLSVLILNAHPAADSAQDEAFYLATALTPAGASSGTSSAIQATVHAGTRLGDLDLRAYDAIVVTGLAGMESADLSGLEEYVRTGGGLLLFPARAANPSNINGAVASLLPATFGPRSILSDNGAVTLNAASITSPALAVLRDTSEIDLGSARFTLVYDLVPLKEDENVQVMCRFNDGKPALVERRIGQGKVVVSAVPAGIAGSNLPYKPAFVPLAHQLAAYLGAGPASQQNVTVGSPLVARFEVKDAGKAVRIKSPGGDVTTQTPVLSTQGLVARFSRTNQVGVYRFDMPGEPQRLFAVNLEAPESDLTRATEAQVRNAIGPIRMSFVRGEDDMEAAVRSARRGSETWRALLFIALPLLFVEALLAQRFGRRS